ncbi:MAG: cytochrome c3 family protein [Syntrophorhabdus sp.]
MKGKTGIVVSMILLVIFLATALPVAFAQKQPPEKVTLKLDGAKFPPVAFSHPLHTQKAKIDCVVCHHKDKNPKEPGSCMPCHDLKDVRNGAIPIKDAYHKKCIDCHKEAVAAKKVNAPTKCNDCHKK